MSEMKEPILHIPESVKEDTLGYRSKVKKYIDGETSAVAFRAYRVPMGIYEQRVTGAFMVRIRIGAGQVLPFQLERIARLSTTYGNGILHITTRQDIQIHEVKIEDTPDVMEKLLEAGLSPRGGGGNTVRNVTACPRAGVCPKEEFDVTGHAIATAEYLLGDRSSFNLPRKYKIVFSGCSADCSLATVADLGFFAHKKNGSRGFSVYAGGGLGSNPNVGIQLEDFVGTDEVFEVAEAIKRLFDKHGDRSNKHKARLRYVLVRVGAEEFKRLYADERATLKKDGLPSAVPAVRDVGADFAVNAAEEITEQESEGALPEKVAGRYTVRLKLKNGDIGAGDLERVGQIAAEYGQGLVRTTQLQGLLISGVAGENIGKVNEELKKLSVDVFGQSGLKVVACTGAATCKLGLCLSRGLADAISDTFRESGVLAEVPETVIRISGCPNSCGHHYVADIGFQGRAKRVNGRLVPCYDILTDANNVEGDARLAKRIGTVPAKAIPGLLSEAAANGGIDKDALKKLALRYGDLGANPLPDDYYYDFGSDEAFSLAGRGPGECGAGVMDIMRVDIDEAKGAVKSDAAGSEDIYRAVITAARTLLVTFGLEPKKDREILAGFVEHIIEPGWVDRSAQQLLDDVVDWRMGDKDSITGLLGQTRKLVDRVEELFLSLDAHLKFKAEPAAQQASKEDSRAEDHTIDLRGVACPLNFVKAKLELEKLATGEVLSVLLDEGEPVRNVPASFGDQGQEIVGIESLGDHSCVKVRRTK